MLALMRFYEICEVLKKQSLSEKEECEVAVFLSN